MPFRDGRDMPRAESAPRAAGPFAEAPVPTPCPLWHPDRRRYEALGGYDGVGILIRLATCGAAQADGDPDAFVSVFLRESTEICEKLSACSQNYTVIRARSLRRRGVKG